MEKIFNSNMHCAACKGNIESKLKKIDGVFSVEANLVTNVVKVNFNDKKVTSEDIISACKEIGYKLEEIEGDETEILKDKSYKIDIIKLIVGGILLIALMYLSMSNMREVAVPNARKEPIWLLPTIELILTLAIIGIFFNYYISGFKSLIKLSPNMDSLIFIGSFFSLVYSIYLLIKLFINPEMYYIYESLKTSESSMMFHSFFDSAAMILVIVSIGKLIENLSKRKAKSTINELLKLRPKYANVLIGKEVKQVETKFLNSGDQIIIKEGETIPLDGLIIDGVTSVDESLLTGESLPVLKKDGDEVIGGSINKEGTIIVLINKTKKDNLLNKIISLVMEASNMNTKLTRKVDKVAKIFVPVVILLAILVFTGWFIGDLIQGKPLMQSHFMSPFDEAFTFGVSVVVISCPCALGLATPISLLVGSSIFAKRGILVNKSEAIENIKGVDAIVLDKTNTITNGELSVVEIEKIIENSKVLDRIYSIESFATHPLSKGISDYLKDKCELDKTFIMISNVPGKGVKGVYKDETIFIGNINLFEETYVGDDKNDIFIKMNEKIKEGVLPIIGFSKNEANVIFLMKDKLKENAKDFILEIKKAFKRVILLTGDNEIIAKNIAKEVGIDEVISDVKPSDKGEVVAKLQNEGYKVVMVGDGVNDSIALTKADVGIGLAKGSDVALASSDFILMNSNLFDILAILRTSKLIRQNISFNLLWAFFYNVILIPLAAGALACFGVMLTPMHASMLMALSSVTVCLNSLSLYLHKNK